MKIAFVAMSGIRANDKELLRLGLTLPGFVERSQAIASLPSLALLTLAGMTPKHHEIEYIEVPDLSQMEHTPVGFDVAAISTFSAQVEEAYLLADRIRLSGTKVIMGGTHVSSLPEEAAEHCDAVIIGEGETQWLAVLEDAEAGRLKQFYGDRFGGFDLAKAPMPAFEILQKERYNRLTVQTSRGCPLRCEFCAGSILFTRKYKQKTKEKVIAEVQKIKAIWKRPFIEFADDNSLVDRKYWRRLLPELAKERIRWFAETDISLAQDPELLSMMKDSGCAQVLIGLESPVDAGLDGLELRSNWKLNHLVRYKRDIAAIQSHGIRVIGCFIVGLDGHDERIFENIYEFVNETGLFDVQITVPTPFPGTPFYERLKADGRLMEEQAWSKCTLFDVNFRPSHMTSEELAHGFRQLGVRLYSQEMTRLRRDRFKEQARTGKSRADLIQEWAV